MINYFYKLLAKFKLYHRYRRDLEINKIFEGFITQNILDGGSDSFVQESREQLIQVKNEIGANKRLIKYLKTHK